MSSPDSSHATEADFISLYSSHLSFKTLEKLREFDLDSAKRMDAFSPNEVKKIIFDAEQEMAKYDAEIGRLKNAIIALENCKIELDAYTKELKWLLSPIRRLPMEVLSQIMCGYTTSPFEDSVRIRFERDRVDAPPIVLAQVCKHWRSVAMTTPHLWSRIDLHLKSGTIVDDEERRKAVSSVLSLSKSCPLSVMIFEDYGSKERGTLHPALQGILQESYRWESLVLHGFDYPSLTLVFGSIDRGCHNLHSLGIAFLLEYIVSDADIFGVVPILQTAPNLRSFTLKGDDYNIVPSNVLRVITWNHLQHITIERGFDISTVLTVMASCTNATSALIQRPCFYEFGSVADSGMDPTTLPITSLGLQCDGVPVPSGGDYLVDWQWLLAFKLPSLRVLGIYYGDWSDGVRSWMGR
jgi:hypothetical protein